MCKKILTHVSKFYNSSWETYSLNILKKTFHELWLHGIWKYLICSKIVCLLVYNTFKNTAPFLNYCKSILYYFSLSLYQNDYKYTVNV